MLSAGFEPAIPKIKRPQTYVLDHAATGIGKYHCESHKVSLESNYAQDHEDPWPMKPDEKA
jgi:hypothetical protein